MTLHKNHTFGKNAVIAMCIIICTVTCGILVYLHHYLNVKPLQEAIAAVYITPQNGNALPFDHSTLAFIFPDGSYLTKRTDQTDTAKLSWTNSGLYQIGTKRDLWVSNKGTVHSIDVHDTPSPWQNGMGVEDGQVVLSDGHTLVATHNNGFYSSHPNEYHEEVAVFDGHHSSRQHVTTQTQLSYLSACGMDVYALYSRQTNLNSFSSVLLSVTKNGSVTNRIVSSHPAIFGEPGQDGNSLPCQNGIIMQLSSNTAGREDDSSHLPSILRRYVTQEKAPVDYTVKTELDHQLLILEKWNVRTGKQTALALHTRDGQPLHIPYTDLTMMYDQYSLQNNELYWMRPSGQLYATNVNTGLTRCITCLKVHNDTEIHPIFSRSRVSILFDPNDGKSSGDIIIKEVSLKTGAIVRTLRVK
jgi:hypothetical protein